MPSGDRQDDPSEDRDAEAYYARICRLNIEHYAAEIPYYSTASSRPPELVLLGSLNPRSTVLDLGCGAGRFSITALSFGHSVVGLDRTEASIRAAALRGLEYGTCATFLTADMTRLPFDDASFDYVFCPRFSINAVATVQRRRAAIQEMLRVVGPGGQVFIESFNRWWLGASLPILIRREFNVVRAHVGIALAALTGSTYKGLLPGDIVYPANKVAEAPPGFAHLPSPLALLRWIPRDVRWTLRSAPEVIDGASTDYARLWRYSLWLTLFRNA